MADQANTIHANPNGPTPAERPIRASDADRHATVLSLQDAMAIGLLTPDEASQRITAAYTAIGLQELGPLTADLPPTPVGPDGPPGWRVIVMMAVEQMRFWLHKPGTGRLAPVRIIVTLTVGVLLVLAVGLVASQMFDSGPPSDPSGFGRR
jgi:hypothetical protein